MKLNILFVDDDENILASFRSMLHAMRKVWTCQFASSAEEGLRKIRAAPFDVVVADMRMPHMDGIEMLEIVERESPDTVRIILSGYSERQSLLNSTKYAHQFLTKPCSSSCLVDVIRRVVRLRHILTEKKVRAAVTRIGTLPALPEMFLQITEELNNVEPDLKRIGALARRDPGISATLLKVVNSSFFGFYETVSDPSRAAVLLGTEILKGLVLGVNFLRQLDADTLDGYSVEKLWGHSLQVGYYAKTIAAMESKDSVFVDNCFVAGLLHDIGKLVFVTSMSDLYAKVLSLVRSEGGPVVGAEGKALGTTHAEIGAYLMALWGFDEAVVEGIYCHHAVRKCDGGLSVGHIVHVANVLQHELAPQQSAYAFSKMDMDGLEAIGLSERIDAWRERCIEYTGD
ncbi:MAG: HDOD domain-containing protein [Pseudodesulfovibrio sp.]|uniref:HD-like signal output (HDOD) protein n=1 Tax=Pseudodesulfovibrio indicus TaxID=1716143 RepID=A0A126QQ51_9BACT|nr:response regulator [Pseudodesulfovibrio indicus]AMK12091.1 phosphohydrolase [Pseudodesulfovibrio indicus]TDT88691.1 HD-like signal output (HDOD) protein [Pseudodesulfovibrio indicus]